MQRERILLSWSGGKDSVLALHELKRTKDFEVYGLLTSLREDDDRVTMHGVSRDLIEAQAHALGLPIDFVMVPPLCDNRTYYDRLSHALIPYIESGILNVCFGDLYLDDIRDFREEFLESLGMQAHFPLWNRCTKELSWAFVNLKFKAIVTCVDPALLSETFAGRVYDRSLLSDLPLAVDPCGENGEFHTFVFDGPLFHEPVPIKLGERYNQDRFHYCEIESRAASVPSAIGRVRSV